ncbi:MAG: Resolvase [Candidatus Roizmanbacteria bacterium GW2011_GWC2_37_13]|uniref:Resolvase n=1 Tax=Candidatus Roizmanbacteria bacterium GW2011_GWC2_37_13 TaxID=1618486 RepID=A0A0G0JBM2_9BACT|nr:MAG: Resolvase [Candidatus Roizmanbacteria bacterium GW2011_GWC2_37_13]
MKTAIFCRVSSKEQEETGYSLPAQEKFLREYANKQGLEVAKVFAVSESAAGKVQRKIFIEMVAYVRKHDIPTIIVETTDRLTRNFSDVPTIDLWITENENHQVHLAKEGCVLHNSSRSHEWFMWRVKVATAEYYVRLLSENVKKGQKEKIAQGWIPTKPPNGYKTVGETGHKIHLVDEGVAPLIRKMFEFYATGDYSIKKLAKTIHEEGLRSPMGNRLANSRIHSLLQDPFYIGKIRWNDEIYEGKHEPLISKELFDKVQAMLKSKTTPKYRKHLFLFKGLIKCAECGKSITWETAKGHNYGHCNHYHNCSQKTWAKEPEVEEQLLGGLDNLKIKNSRIVDWLKKALKESHQDEIAYHNSTVGELQARYEAVQKRLDKLYDDKLDEKITPDFYNRKFKQYSEEKDEVVESIKRHSQASTGYLNLGINIYELSQRAKEIYLKAKAKDMLDEQRSLIRLVFADLRLDEGKLSYIYSKTFKILSEAVSATNGSNVDKFKGFGNGKFEPAKKSDVTGQKDSLLPSRPIWLPRRDSNAQPYS